MSAGWTAKRFWTRAEARAVEGGWTVELDARTVRTPGKSLLIVPTEALARGIAAEWDAQEGVIRPNEMPLTRAANSAIEKVTPQRAEVVAILAEYGQTDLTCYRAEAPDALVARQAALWDPLLDWTEAALGARLIPVQGVMYQAQDSEAVARMRAALEVYDPFALTAVHDLVTLTGSLVIGLATARGHLTGEEAWPLTRVDESWQEEHWGLDEEAAEMSADRRSQFLQAERLLSLLEG